MTVQSRRRGEIRAISALPAAPAGAQLIEVEVGGAAYQASAPSGGGSSFFKQTATQLVMRQPVGLSAFTDDTGKVVTVTGAVAGVADADVPGGLAAGFSGAGGVLAVPPGSDFLFMTQNFSVEGWFKSTQAAQQFTTLAEHDNGAFGASSWSLLFNNGTAADGKIGFYHSDFGGQVAVTTVGGFNDGVRHHVYAARLGQTFEIWVDGVRRSGSVLQGGSPLGVFNNGTMKFGNSVFANRFFIGHLDNWRVCRVALPYTVSPFALPVPPFPTS